METQKIEFESDGVTAEIRSFALTDGVEEYHVMLHVAPQGDLFYGQWERLCRVEDALMADALAGCTPIMKRYFLSDIANQQPLMDRMEPCAVSFVGQPPLDGSKVGCWVYLLKDASGTLQTVLQDGAMRIAHNGYQHLWKMGYLCDRGTSAEQTTAVLQSYKHTLEEDKATLVDHCIRTWFFVRDVDTQYSGLVKARKEFFVQEGLTEETHYVTSTGIGGVPAKPHALLQLDTYTLTGFHACQQQYLYAPTHLNPTYEYGVTFERGTAITYGDRKQIFISGTASINNRGEVVHVGNIEAQTLRMWENVGQLLQEAGATHQDIMQILVYLRDPADYEQTKQRFEKLAPGVPVMIVLAPVCRPTWLIEMECMAVKPYEAPEYNKF